MAPSDQGMEISFLAMLGWVLPAGVVAGGIGAYPTWRVGGAPAVTAMLTAGGIVLAVKAACAVFVIRKAAGGAARAAFAFVVAGMARAVLCLVLAGVAWSVLALPPKPLFVWVGVFYLAMLAGEGVWMARALQRDAFLLALGRKRRPGAFGVPAGDGEDAP